MITDYILIQRNEVLDGGYYFDNIVFLSWHKNTKYNNKADNIVAIYNSGLLRIAFSTSDGTKYVIVGSVIQDIDISTVYGYDYIGEFTIEIPSLLRFNMPLSVSINCQGENRVVTCGRGDSTVSQIKGWVQSSCSGLCKVTFSIIYWGY